MMIKQIKSVNYVRQLVILVKVIKIYALNVLIHKIEHYLVHHVFAYQDTTIQEVMFVRSALIIV